jgi:hypothetical protein
MDQIQKKKETLYKQSQKQVYKVTLNIYLRFTTYLHSVPQQTRTNHFNTCNNNKFYTHKFLFDFQIKT